MAFPLILLGGVVAMIVFVAVMSVQAFGPSGSRSSNAVPQEFLTPLLCDVRKKGPTNIYCGERAVILETCGVGVLYDIEPDVASGPRGGASFIWKRRGKAQAIMDFVPSTITVRTQNCYVEIDRADYELAMDPALGQADLPEVFRR